MHAASLILRENNRAHMAPRLHIFKADTSSSLPLLYADAGIKAGFPSPAQDYMTESIDLNELLVRQKETTFYARVDGDSMVGVGICNGDIAIIDKSLEARNGDYVVAYIDGEFTIKQYKLDDSHACAWLIPANKKYRPIKVTIDNDFRVWGVVTGVIRKFR